MARLGQASIELFRAGVVALFEQHVPADVGGVPIGLGVKGRCPEGTGDRHDKHVSESEPEHGKREEKEKEQGLANGFSEGGKQLERLVLLGGVHPPPTLGIRDRGAVEKALTPGFEVLERLESLGIEAASTIGMLQSPGIDRRLNTVVKIALGLGFLRLFHCFFQSSPASTAGAAVAAGDSARHPVSDQGEEGDRGQDLRHPEPGTRGEGDGDRATPVRLVISNQENVVEFRHRLSGGRKHRSVPTRSLAPEGMAAKAAVAAAGSFITRIGTGSVCRVS